MLTFEPAEFMDAEELTRIQICSFAKDVEACGDGPPGYDSVESQNEKILKYNFYKILEDKVIVGGFYYTLLDPDTLELIRLFIEPKHQGKGLGCKALEFLETLSEIKVITLEASDFNIQNQKYYENRGYNNVGKKYYTENDYSVVYKKVIK
ncbi:MAG: GNAT family N-acetyltransferase [Spirochaetaceae bacterium]